jgi:rhamnosyltransferase
MSAPKLSVIMRSFNEGWALKETLPALKSQSITDWELIVIDSGSTDGSIELIRDVSPQHFIQIHSSEYNPSRVMNQGMELSATPYGIFLNADATPQNENWLAPLFEALHSKKTAAAFSRQIPRADCDAVFASDYERCFGEQRDSKHWDHFFSMVSSGLRKDVWLQRGFDESLTYAEDDEYTRWCVSQGYTVEYCPESVAIHSHNYTVKQSFQRGYGDALAMAHAGSVKPAQESYLRTRILGTLSDLKHDIRYCLNHRKMAQLPHAMKIRWAQRKGKWLGYNRRPLDLDRPMKTDL